MNDEDEVADRLSRRFNHDEDEKSDEAAEVGDEAAEDEEVARPDEQIENVKEIWRNTSIYLPENLRTRMQTAYKRKNLEVDLETGDELRKTRHYYPLLIALGVEAIEEMEPEEILERVDAIYEDALKDEAEK